MRRSFVFFFGLLGVLAIALPSVAQAPGSIGIRLVDAPTERADDPRARLYIVDHVAPGARLSRRIEVRNGTDGPVRLDLYTAAAQVRGGSFEIGEGRATNELTEWVRIEPAAINLAPGQRAQATVRIAVPSTASAGERYAAALAELPPAAAESGRISVGARVGVRIYLSVGAGGEPVSDFEIETLTAGRSDDGRPTVSTKVRNTGERALDIAGDLSLSDGPGGLRAGPFPAEVAATVAKGQEAPVVVLLDQQVPPGPWKARIVLRSGRVERTAEATIVFPIESGRTSAPVDAREVTGTTGGRLALGGAGLLLSLTAALLTTILWRRRR